MLRAARTAKLCCEASLHHPPVCVVFCSSKKTDGSTAGLQICTVLGVRVNALPASTIEPDDDNLKADTAYGPTLKEGPALTIGTSLIAADLPAELDTRRCH